MPFFMATSLMQTLIPLQHPCSIISVYSPGQWCARHCTGTEQLCEMA